MALRVAAVGEISFDHYVDLGVTRLGGCSCNFARAAARAGAEVSVFAPVGDDYDRELARHERRVAGATARQKIRLHAGERELCGWEPGVVASYRLGEDELAELAAYDVIALADTPAWDQCLALVGPRKVADFSQDAHTPWRFDGLDIAFVGGAPSDLDRLRPLARDRLVVLTAGAAGVWAITGERVVHQPAPPIVPVDTTGCGDAFQGTFTVAHFTGASIEDALRAATAAAQDVAMRIGA